MAFEEIQLIKSNMNPAQSLSSTRSGSGSVQMLQRSAQQCPFTKRTYCSRADLLRIALLIADPPLLVSEPAK